MWIVNKYNPYKYIPNGGYSVGMYQEPGEEKFLECKQTYLI